MNEEPFTVISGNTSKKFSKELQYITEECEKKYKTIKKANHEWIDSLEESKFKEYIDKIRKSDILINKIREEFPNTTVKNVTEGDEIYWAVSPKGAKGSDRSLVDCHYDAPFAVLPRFGVTYYRIIIATNENDTITTIFPDENKKVKMSTGDFHGLDYNKDWHCVDGAISEGKYRVLLKLHYIIIPKGSEPYENYVRSINIWWTQFSRETMRMSADPKNILEQIIGSLVNITTIIFNYFYTILIIIIITYIFSSYNKIKKNIFYLMKYLRIK
jgi:hypothetical protein